ncbi:MAG: aldo/keto reductase [Armatimonadota bacterium]
MNCSNDGKELSRRDFLRSAALAAAALGAAGGIKMSSAGAASDPPAKTDSMERRVLGRTGLQVSVLGLGTIKIANPAVVRTALDKGINFFDTAECYQGGNSEVTLGKGLKGRRDEAIVATKWHTDGSTPAKELLESLDQSLKRLDMDHVDLIQIHGADNAQQVESDQLWEAFTEAKKAGKVRFNGLTCHGNQVEVIQAAIKTGRYDAVLPAYNALIGERVAAVVAEAKKAGIGVIAMKVLQPAHEGKTRSSAFRGLRGNPYQQSIQWVVRDENVSTAIVDMPTFEELSSGCTAVARAAHMAELGEFEEAVALMSASACHLCGACTGQCPRGVRVSDIMRYRLYHEGYGDRQRAAELYRALPTSASAAACVSCPGCKVVCPWGVPVRGRLEQMHGVLA